MFTSGSDSKIRTTQECLHVHCNSSQPTCGLYQTEPYNVSAIMGDRSVVTLHFIFSCLGHGKIPHSPQTMSRLNFISKIAQNTGVQQLHNIELIGDGK